MDHVERVERARRRVVVVCDSPLYDAHVHGGLQVKCRLLFAAFAETFRVALFCGDQSDVRWPSTVAVFHAFSADCRFKTDYLDAFQKEVAAADVLISVETELPIPVTLPTVLIMGGVAYDWSARIIRSRAWTAVITPSADAAARARAVVPLPVHAIANGYDWDSFKRDTSGVIDIPLPARRLRSKVLIHPHRPEHGKGADAARDLVTSLLGSGQDCWLCIPEQGLHTSDRDHYSTLKRTLPARYRDRFIFHRWLARTEMPRYYGLADVTLALGDVPEGFGATIVESIGCGTPVLATRRGAVESLFPPDHGLLLVDDGDRSGAVRLATTLFEMDPSSRRAMLDRGRQYAVSHYDSRTMTARYLGVIDGVIA